MMKKCEPIPCLDVDPVPGGLNLMGPILPAYPQTLNVHKGPVPPQ